jgi:hypothetical protein
VGGRKLPPERVEAVLGYLAAGLNPVQAVRAAGVGRTVAYDLDRRVGGVSRLAAKRAAAARRAVERAARQQAAAGRVRVLTDLLAAGMSPYRAGPALMRWPAPLVPADVIYPFGSHGDGSALARRVWDMWYLGAGNPARGRDGQLPQTDARHRPGTTSLASVTGNYPTPRLQPPTRRSPRRAPVRLRTASWTASTTSPLPAPA